MTTNILWGARIACVLVLVAFATSFVSGKLPSPATGIDDANIFFGAVVDPRYSNEIQVTVIATGIGEPVKHAKPAEPDVQPMQAPVRAYPVLEAVNLDRPTFRRTQPESDSPKRVIRSFIDDDLETPTFLRKQMD